MYPNNRLNSFQFPHDYWTDYVFAIVSLNQDIALPNSSTYQPCSNARPDWLPTLETDLVNIIEGIGYYTP